MRVRWPKEAFVFAIRWSGIPWLLRITYGRNKISILVYHDPRPTVLEQHLRYLSRRYAFVTMDAVVDAARSGDWVAVPANALAITFDDGHRGNVELLDLFRRYGVVPTIFACTQIVGTNRHYWWNSCDDYEPLKRVPNDVRLRLLREHSGFSQAHEYEPAARQALTSDEIRRLGAHADFGSHTRFHPILPMCSDEEARAEIVVSKEELEQITGRRCRHFSYPNGDYSKREIELLRASGYESARTTEPGWNARNPELFELKVIGAPDEGSVNHLAASVVTFFLKRLLHGVRRRVVPEVSAAGAEA
jgi:peptidoglycan/xylan/chitin deacetylase (PgdA/CDA1 family)